MGIFLVFTYQESTSQKDDDGVAVGGLGIQARNLVLKLLEWQGM